MVEKLDRMGDELERTIDNGKCNENVQKIFALNSKCEQMEAEMEAKSC